MSWWSSDADGVTINVRAVPGARRSEVAEYADDHVRVRLAAPAVEGKANAELVRFCAGWFGVRRSAVALVRGDHSRLKVVRVSGVDHPPEP